MAQKPLSQDVAQQVIDAIHEALEEGFPMDGNKNGRGAMAEAAFRLGIPSGTMFARVNAAKRLYGLEIDPERFRKKQSTAIFELLDLPDDGEPSAEEMIEILAKRQRVRLHHHEAAKLREVRMRIPGPVALVGFGDPHVDDPGCDWASLRADVNTCRDTLGMLAIGIGDNSNNWVGRLMKLYADQEVTARQSLKLIEWLMTSLPWLLQVKGNHDCHDMETEALTKEGWKLFQDIKDHDEILSFSPGGRAVWSHILEKIHRPNTDQMVTVEARAMNFNVTPNHRVLHRKRVSGTQMFTDWKYCRADQLPHRFALPVSAPSGHPEYPLPDHMVALVGWFLTDGGVHWAGDSPAVTFYQSKDIEGLEALLAATGYGVRKVTRIRTTKTICGKTLVNPPLPSFEYKLPAADGRAFMAIAEGKGRLPSWVDQLSERQFRVLLEAIIAGDGAWGSGGGECAMIHGTKAFLDDLQAKCVSHGWHAHLSVAREKDWRLSVSLRSEWQAERTKVVRRTKPSPFVWCLRVPHGNFMVRRKGKSHFSGNSWNTEKGDVADYIHRLSGSIGAMESSGARLRLNFNNGSFVNVHARHDFPGGSQFNPAHALVRQTLFDYRDHILMCGHRHTSGYIPIWHNDPKRLCHGMRLGAYKTMDHYADEKGFKEGNWARAMAAVIDPDLADDPVRHIKVWFNVQEAAEYLTWRRKKWELGYSAAV